MFVNKKRRQIVEGSDRNEFQIPISIRISSPSVSIAYLNYLSKIINKTMILLNSYRIKYQFQQQLKWENRL